MILFVVRWMYRAVSLFFQVEPIYPILHPNPRLDVRR